MKNIIRANRKGDNKRRCSQEQSTRRARLSAPAEPGIKDGSFSGNEPVSLTLNDQKSDVILAGIDATSEKLQALKTRAKSLGVSASALLEASFNHMIDYKPGLPSSKKSAGNDDLTIGMCAVWNRRGKERVKVIMRDIEINDQEWTAGCRKDIRMRDAGDGNFFGNAIRKALVAPADDGFSNLEITITKTEGLLQLLADKFEHLARVDGDDFHGEAANRFCAAVSLLVAEAQKNLRGAFDKTFHAAHATAQEAAEQSLAA